MTKFYDDGVTILAIVTILIAAFSMVTKLCFKSKCSNKECNYRYYCYSVVIEFCHIILY